MNHLSAILLTFTCGLGFAGEPTPGSHVYGLRDFIEYIPGDLPLVVAAPHGGHLTPNDLPDRKSGETSADANTQDLARQIANVIHEQTGHHIHLVICRLHRRKLDVNREIMEAAQGDKEAELAWKEHHGFIEQACASAVKRFGVAFLIDLHGHGHPVPHVELGCLQNVQQLAKSDEALNEKECIEGSSLRWIVEHGTHSHAKLLRGPMSFGAILESNGFAATPSLSMPVPTQPFFRGGYTISRHCRSERNVTGLQIETNRPRLRDTAANRLKFAQALFATLESYLPVHIGLGIDGMKTTLAKHHSEAGLEQTKTSDQAPP
ncbi:N-formylglutamate amidohydrolase [Prosthecobacter vanneervenii]|uniref:N-formylglutamate amidohydrolase n=1 Tax=Prosthecobacter vanneervenii TaxID=48466 RepID=A0A7W8DMD2_9BACT|nr:hypothetical protein [Prosthecobacter vanneervenii]MBB5035102.1 N-formylglutamate amidohydrolase [Prosthecobacter vanneervenii]